LVDGTGTLVEASTSQKPSEEKKILLDISESRTNDEGIICFKKVARIFQCLTVTNIAVTVLVIPVFLYSSLCLWTTLFFVNFSFSSY
jgi:uncharacterized membrane protein